MPARLDTLKGRLSNDTGLTQWFYKTALPKSGMPRTSEGITTFQFMQREGNGLPSLNTEELIAFLIDELSTLGISVTEWISSTPEIERQ